MTRFAMTEVDEGFTERLREVLVLDILTLLEQKRVGHLRISFRQGLNGLIILVANILKTLWIMR